MTDKKKDAKGDVATELLIQEIEDDLKQEKFAKLWNRFGGVVIGACIAIVVIVAGYQGWQSYYKSLRAKEYAAYAAANALATPAETAAALDKLALEAKTGYDTLAELRRAAVLADAGDTRAAAAAYDTIAVKQDIDAAYRNLAVLRSVMLSLDSGDPAALAARLQPLLATGWRHSALEMQALLAQRQGDAERARQLYQQIADDAAAPQGLRGRAAEMLAALGGATAPDRKG